MGTFWKRTKLKRLFCFFVFYISANYQGCSVFTLIVARKSLWRPYRVCSFFDIGFRAQVTVNNSGKEKNHKMNCHDVVTLLWELPNRWFFKNILLPFSLDAAGLTFLMMLCWWWCSQCLLNFGGIYCSP